MTQQIPKTWGRFIESGQRYSLTSPTIAPNADAFLWNASTMLQMTCRGYATAQFMQPEPAKYAHGPMLSAKTFMQPEQSYFSHHAGRFFYVQDNDSGRLWSAPHEPVRAPFESFRFEPGLVDIRWVIENLGIETTLECMLTDREATERWRVTLKNTRAETASLRLTPYFPVGYASWMNQGGDVDADLQAVIAKSITPYQKLEDYPKQKHFKDLTFLAASAPFNSWSARQQSFEGEGGLHNPSALENTSLDNAPARYENPACIQQFKLTIPAGEEVSLQFLFGAAQSTEEIADLRARYLGNDSFDADKQIQLDAMLTKLHGFKMESQDDELNHVVNHWLPRQLLYHGSTNRLTTDPQTRNYLQDAMGMAYLDARATKAALLSALSQQHRSGQMPDGILLPGATELKYINQIPHTDHGIWVVLCLASYLRETGDSACLSEVLPFGDSNDTATLAEHVHLSLQWLLKDRDARGLSYIAQGDWCDPMNMVGHKGKGVSAWLTQALAVALKQWLPICEQLGDQDHHQQFTKALAEQHAIIQEHLWDGDWFIRGITDDGRPFGSHRDEEGQIFINTQAWALLADAANDEQKTKLLASVAEKLETPYGVQLGAPAFTKMHEDIGRVTQKFPGTAENGSVYNHAAMFWSAALFQVGESDRAIKALTDCWSFENQEGLVTRGQLPLYIPNYFRGAVNQFPETAGRSSRLFNTGTAAWAFQLWVEQVAGFQGTDTGLRVAPNLPSDWKGCEFKRTFRGAYVSLTISRDSSSRHDQLFCNDQPVPSFEIQDIQVGKHYRLRYIVGG